MISFGDPGGPAPISRSRSIAPAASIGAFADTVREIAARIADLDPTAA